MLALFVALDGPGYAGQAIEAAKKKLDGKQLEKNSVPFKSLDKKAKKKIKKIARKQAGAGPAGPQGPAGANGAPGATGPVGPAGPTASAYDESRTSGGLSGSFIQLASVDITLDVESRVHAYFNVEARGNGGGDDVIRCTYNLGGATGETVFATAPGNSPGADAMTVTVFDSRVLAPGTHEVRVSCLEDAGSITVSDRQLSVIAVGT